MGVFLHPPARICIPNSVAGAVETAAAEEIDKDAFGTFLLMISSAAWKSLRTNRSGFPTVPPAPTAITESQDPRETNTTFLLLPMSFRLGCT